MSLLLLSMVFFISFLCFQQWYADWQLIDQPSRPIAPLSKQDNTKILIAHLPSAHLFGQSLARDVPITNLQLRVTGIVKSEKEEEALSKAYISISGQPSKIYQLGDRLPYGVRVYAITKNAVILENNRRLEKLPLPRTQLEFKKIKFPNLQESV